jgi:hypothetical protein
MTTQQPAVDVLLWHRVRRRMLAAIDDEMR